MVQGGGDETWDGYPGDFGFDVCSTKNGGAYVTGRVHSADYALFGEGTGNEISFVPPEDGVIYLARYDGDGVPLWVSSASTAGNGGFSCSTTAGGGAVVAGSLDGPDYWSSGGTNVFGAGEAGEVDLDLAVVRAPFVGGYRPDGSFDWVTAGDGNDGYASAFDSAVAPSGEICIAGRVRRPFRFCSGEACVEVWGPGTGDGVHRDGYLARFDAEGVPLWARELNGPGPYDQCNGVAALPDGSCAVACMWSQYAVLEGGQQQDVVFQLDNGYGGLVALYSPEGDLEWATDLGIRGGYPYAPNGMAADSASFIMVGGMTNHSIDTPEGEIQSQGADLFLSKITPAGEIAWTAVAGGPGEPNGGSEGVHGIDISSEGEIAVTGSFSGTKTFGAGEVGETTLVSGGITEGHENGFAALYTGQGRLRWAIPVALGPAFDFTCTSYNEQDALGISFAGPDTLYITGWFLEGSSFGTSPDRMVTLQPYGCADMFLMKLERVAEDPD